MIAFECNICGQRQETELRLLDREIPSCGHCGSNVRFRSIVHLLSQELFGESLSLPEMPRIEDVSILGLSDWTGYAEPLAARFDYANTYYDREPRLDITNPPHQHEGRYDFVIASEVFEHVPPPVERAFRMAAKLLKPEGVLILTVPYDLGHRTREHFPGLHRYALTELAGEPLLVNRREDGTLEVFDGLVFHGGSGATLEMRVFRDDELRDLVLSAGFTEVDFAKDGFLRFGIVHHVDWSLPIVARKAPFHVSKPTVAKLARGVTEAERARDASAARVGELERRLVQLSEEFEERTRWAKQLDAELAGARALIADLQGQLEERTRWALALDAELGRLRSAGTRLAARLRAHEDSRLVQLARRLGLVRESESGEE